MGGDVSFNGTDGTFPAPVSLIADAQDDLLGTTFNGGVHRGLAVRDHRQRLQYS
jgi:hypothetical protein